MADPQLIASLAPPLVGTLAGYGAARLALFLLFKPRKPWRLFGLRLPMTPGAFAAGRHLLAKNIGEAVGGELLGRAETERAINEPRFQEQLRRVIDTRLADLLDRDLGPPATLVPARFRSFYEMGGKVLRLRFQQLLHTHLDSPSFADALRDALTRHDMGSNDAGEENVIALIRSPQCKRLLDTLLAELLSEKVLARPIGPLAKLLPAEVQEGVGDLLVREVNALLLREVPRLAEVMDSGEITARQVEALDHRQFEALLRPAMARRANIIALLGALFGLALGLATTLLPGSY